MLVRGILGGGEDGVCNNQSYQSAVRYLHIQEKYRNPFENIHSRLDLVLRGAKRSCGSAQRQPRLPINAAIFSPLRRHLSPKAANLT